MPTTFSGSSNIRSSYTLSDSPTIGTAGETAQLRVNRSIDNGTGIDEANAAWRQVITVPQGQVYSLDLTNLGATVFGFGGKVSLSVLKELFVVVPEFTSQVQSLGPGVTPGSRILFGCISSSDTTGYAAELWLGADYRWSDYQVGKTITSGNKFIYIANPANSGGTVKFDILLVGNGTYSDT